jgi:hypothetical protein
MHRFWLSFAAPRMDTGWPAHSRAILTGALPPCGTPSPCPAQRPEIRMTWALAVGAALALPRRPRATRGSRPRGGDQFTTLSVLMYSPRAAAIDDGTLEVHSEAPTGPSRAGRCRLDKGFTAPIPGPPSAPAQPQPPLLAGALRAGPPRSDCASIPSKRTRQPAPEQDVLLCPWECTS